MGCTSLGEIREVDDFREVVEDKNWQQFVERMGLNLKSKV
jgi:hypothetical protein